MFRHCLLATAVLAGSFFPLSAASACSAISGSTSWDSVQITKGDPFFGGTWGNANGASAYIQRTVKTPVTINGFFMRRAGSDITSDGSRILVRARSSSNGQWITLMDVRNVVIGRDFSGGIVPRRLDPITMSFPEISVTALRVDMTGHGWFSMDETVFFVKGCSY